MVHEDEFPCWRDTGRASTPIAVGLLDEGSRGRSTWQHRAATSVAGLASSNDSSQPRIRAASCQNADFEVTIDDSHTFIPIR